VISNDKKHTPFLVASQKEFCTKMILKPPILTCRASIHRVANLTDFPEVASSDLSHDVLRHYTYQCVIDDQSFTVSQKAYQALVEGM
jgi:hypothetical protein